MAKRSDIRCRTMILFLGLLRFVTLCKSAPTNIEELATARSVGRPSATVLPSLGRSSNQEIGSPSELAWQAWLLVDARTGAQSGLESASTLRRLTPKSVFIAPSLPACAEGYQADTMGRCVKLINIDHKAHIDFLLERLNAMYANGGISGGNNDDDNKPQSSAATGPLQLNIPLLEGSLESSMPKAEEERPEDSMEVAVVVSPQGTLMKDEREAIVTVYEPANDTTKSGKLEETFFRESSTDGHHGSSTTDHVVPVVEIIGENRENVSDVVDYKYPVVSPTESPLISQSDVVVSEDKELMKNSNSSSDEVPPTLVLLLSPTKVPLTVSTPNMEELEVAHNSTAGHVLVRLENVTGNVTGKEIISIGVAVSTVRPVEVPLESTDAMSQDQNFGQSTESQFQSEVNRADEATSVITDLNSDGDRSTTRPPDQLVQAGDDLRQRIIQGEKERDSEPKVVFSSQDTHETTPGNVNNKKRAEHVAGTESQDSESAGNVDGQFSNFPTTSLSYPDAVLYDPHHDDPYPEEYLPEIHTIDEQASYVRESLALPNHQDTGHFRPLNSSDFDDFRPSVDFEENSRDFVRFPDMERTRNNERAGPARPTNYVRFPSEEANSIQTQNYKDRLAFFDSPYSSTSTKSSVPIHQKQSYWWVPPGWRVNRQQPYQQSQSIPNQRQKHRPMLLRFWARMPFPKDPNPYSMSLSTETPLNGPIRSQHGAQFSQVPTNRMNFYKEMNLQDVNRVFTQKFRTPVIGG